VITDRIENAARYQALHPGIARALEFLASSDLDNLTEGRHVIDGEAIYALVQALHHRAGLGQALGVPSPLSRRAVPGERRGVPGWAVRDALTVTQPYAEDKDVTFHGEPADPPACVWTRAVSASCSPPTRTSGLRARRACPGPEDRGEGASVGVWSSGPPIRSILYQEDYGMKRRPLGG